ncbi:MAG: DUF3291 domain-containing protein, partial [Flavobacteriaceae bacterium]
QFARCPLRKVKGQERFFLMGTGKQGFLPWPDWTTYALVQIWENKEVASYFFSSSILYSSYVRKCDELLRVSMRSIGAKGEWGGVNPFRPSAELDENKKMIAVITRATIKTRYQFKFWSAVPEVSNRVFQSSGLRFTKGIGEIPFRNMATFSIWNSEEDMRAFAYRKKEHQTAITMTKKLDWYSEELFSRFQPYEILGSYNGFNLSE